MSSETKAKGLLRFESDDALDEVFDSLDEDDEDGAEVLEVVLKETFREGASLRLEIFAHFSNDGNLEFQTWLEDLAEAATDGHVDTWQEDYGDSMFIRLKAGGEEQEVNSRFPDD